jgi:hypothetical protein
MGNTHTPRVYFIDNDSFLLHQGDTANSNLCVITCDGAFINGNDNTILGSRNVIYGDRCIVYGDENIIVGKHVRVIGNRNKINNNVILVEDGHVSPFEVDSISGNENIVYGKCKEFFGDNNERHETPIIVLKLEEKYQNLCNTPANSPRKE